MALLVISHIKDYDYPRGAKIDSDNPYVLFSLSNGHYTPIEKFPTRKHAMKRYEEMKRG